MRAHGCHGATGSATVWVLACGLAVAGTAGVLAAEQVAAVTRHRAASAADLAALAAAAAQRRALLLAVPSSPGTGSATACSAAQAVAAADGAVLLRCAAQPPTWTQSGAIGLDVEVEVGVRAPLPGGPLVHAVARAGPARPPVP